MTKSKAEREGLARIDLDAEREMLLARVVRERDALRAEVERLRVLILALDVTERERGALRAENERLRAVAKEAQRESNWHNQRGSDGPCECSLCQAVAALQQEQPAE